MPRTSLGAILMVGSLAIVSGAAPTAHHAHSLRHVKSAHAPATPRSGSGSGTGSNGAAGASVALSQAGLSFTCDTVVEPLLTSYVQTDNINDIDTDKDGVKIHIGNMRTYDFDCDHCVNAALVPGKGIQLHLSDFSIHLHSRYTLHKIVSTGGECESKVSGVDVSALVEIGITGDGHPTLQATDVNAGVDKIDLGCKGISGGLLNVLEKVFDDKVKDAIEDVMKSAIPPAMEQLSKNVAKYNLDIPITGGFAEIRFDLSAAPNVTADYVSVAALGTVVPTSTPGQVAPYAIPPIPQYDSSTTSFVQIILSDYSLNSAAYTYWHAGHLATVVTAKEIPPTFPLQLNTSSLAAVAPGLAAKYPTEVPVQILCEADPMVKPTVSILNTEVQVTMPSLLSFQPIPQGQPVDGFTLSCPVEASATLTLTGSAVTGNLSLANCSLTEYNSTVGQINANLINSLVELTLNSVVIPEINKVANQGIPIPSLDGYKLSNSKLMLHDTYAVVATDYAPS